MLVSRDTIPGTSSSTSVLLYESYSSFIITNAFSTSGVIVAIQQVKFCEVDGLKSPVPDPDLPKQDYYSYDIIYKQSPFRMNIYT